MLLLDGTHMLQRDGTGISSYSRSLATTLNSVQMPISLLLDRRVPVSRNSGEIAIANQIFGNPPPESQIRRVVEFLLRSRLSLSRTIAARRIETAMMRLASLDPGLPPHDTLLNIPSGKSFANALFLMRSTITEVVLPEQVMLAHWVDPSPIRVRGVPNVYTMHDVIPLQMPHLVIDRPALASRQYSAVAHSADHIIAVSEHAREDIIRTLRVPAERISVTYQPVPHLPVIDREASARLVRDVYAIDPGDYAFFCGAFEPKKNLYRLIEAFTVAGGALKLLLAGPPGWLYDDVTKLLDQLNAAPLKSARRRVHWLGHLPRLHIAALMQCARFFVFPSIYEGFGLPVAEAMQLGVPVLTSGAGGLAEVVGDAALLANPLDVGDIARQIRVITEDACLRDELARRGRAQAARFSHRMHLDRLAAAYKRVGVTIPVQRGGDAEVATTRA